MIATFIPGQSYLTYTLERDLLNFLLCLMILLSLVPSEAQ